MQKGTQCQVGPCWTCERHRGQWHDSWIQDVDFVQQVGPRQVIRLVNNLEPKDWQGGQRQDVSWDRFSSCCCTGRQADPRGFSRAVSVQLRFQWFIGQSPVFFGIWLKVWWWGRLVFSFFCGLWFLLFDFGSFENGLDSQGEPHVRPANVWSNGCFVDTEITGCDGLLD